MSNEDSIREEQLASKEGKISSASKIGESQAHVLRSLKDTELALNVVLVEQDFEIGELISLSPGNIVMFNGKTSDQAWITVNEKKFAYGSIVQVGEQYGFQIDKLVV